MNVTEAILGRRTVRSFNSEPVTNDQLNEILEAATWAPSHRNTQPWEFIKIGPQTRQELIPLLQKQMENGPLKNPDLPEERKQAMREFAKNFGNAPVLLGVTCEPAANDMDKAEFPLAVSMAIQNLFLAAWEKKIGGVWLSLGFVPETAQVIKLKQGYSVIAILALGHINTVPPAMPRKAVKDKLIELA